MAISALAFSLVLIVLGLCLVYIVLKPDSTEDRFFLMHDQVTLDGAIKRLSLLEKVNGQDYTHEKQLVSSFFLDNKLSQTELDTLEEVITNTYYDGFRKRWIAFIKADIVLKTFFILSLCSGYFLLGAVVFEATSGKGDEWALWQYWLVVALFFPLIMLISFVYFGIFSVLLSFLMFFFPRKGSLFRATITSEEMIRAMKPGGRNTEIDLSSVNWDDMI